MSETFVERQPVLYLSHGAPPLADDDRWTSELHAWSADLPKPKNVLIVSAHWEEAAATLSSTRPHTPLVYDFWGFPERYYTVQYDAPPAVDLADTITRIAPDLPVAHDQSRGLDHGAYVPLKELFPDADVPVLQMSLPTLDPQRLFELGRALAPLRDEGTLIVGSGFTTHNLRWFNPRLGPDVAPPQASAEFDHWAAEAIERKDVDALLQMQTAAPAAHEAHPRTEHWAPLYIALGAADATGDLSSRSVIDGFWFGMSKRSWQFA